VRQFSAHDNLLPGTMGHQLHLLPLREFFDQPMLPLLQQEEEGYS
jgi:hypothetical protein